MTEPDELKTYLDKDGRLTRWPSKGRKTVQEAALHYLAGKLETGRAYSEPEINALLNQWHTFSDPALLRRELFESGQLNRHKDGTQYWATPRTKLL